MPPAARMWFSLIRKPSSRPALQEVQRGALAAQDRRGRAVEASDGAPVAG
jgi:hypothetical protein